MVTNVNYCLHVKYVSCSRELDMNKMVTHSLPTVTLPHSAPLPQNRLTLFFQTLPIVLPPPSNAFGNRCLLNKPKTNNSRKYPNCDVTIRVQ